MGISTVGLKAITKLHEIKSLTLSTSLISGIKNLLESKDFDLGECNPKLIIMDPFQCDKVNWSSRESLISAAIILCKLLRFRAETSKTNQQTRK